MTKTDEFWRNERWKKYEPDALPSQIERRVYILYGIDDWNQGQISIGDIAARGSIVLAQHVITLGIPPQGSKELKGKVLGLLNEEKQKVLAENHERLKAVQDKIDDLLAIEDHSVKQEAV